MSDPTLRWHYRFDNYRRAFEAGIIQEGDTWQKALDDRNRMLHTYHLESFEQVIADIRERYLSVFAALHEWLSVKQREAGPS